MAVKIYGTVNPDTGATVSTRAVESAFNVPKIESTLEQVNTGFKEEEVEYSKQSSLWDWWSEQVSFINPNPEEPVVQTPKAVTTAVSGVKAAGEAISGPFNKILILAALVAAVVVVPRILPVRS